MAIRAVLFDFDDTLGNREEYSHRTYAQRIEECFADEDPWIKEAAVQMCLIYDQHGDVKKKFVQERLLKTMNLDIGDLETYWEGHQYLNAVLYPDARMVVEELRKRGYRTGIITNGDSHNQHEKIRRTGIEDLMDVIVVSGDTDTRKPEPEIFRLAAEQLGLACEECAFVGDMFLNDVLGARNAGMFPVWVWPHGSRYAEIDVVQIHSLSELLPWFPCPGSEPGKGGSGK